MAGILLILLAKKHIAHWVKKYLVTNQSRMPLWRVSNNHIGREAEGFQRQFTAFLPKYLTLYYTPHHKEKVYRGLNSAYPRHLYFSYFITSSTIRMFLHSFSTLKILGWNNNVIDEHNIRSNHVGISNVLQT